MSCIFAANEVYPQLTGGYIAINIIGTNSGIIATGDHTNVSGLSTTCTLFLLVVPIPGWVYVGSHAWTQLWKVNVDGPNAQELLVWFEQPPAPGTPGEDTTPIRLTGPGPTADQKEAAATFLGYKSWEELPKNGDEPDLDAILKHSGYASWKEAIDAYAGQTKTEEQ